MKKQMISLFVCGVLFSVIGYQASQIDAQTVSLDFKLMMVEIPTNDAETLVSFYDAILGLPDEFPLADNVVTDRASFHLPISSDGFYLQINEPKVEDNGPIHWFIVSDLDRVLTNVADNGGTVLTPEPFDVPITDEEFTNFTSVWSEALGENPPDTDTLGRVSFVTDPSGNELAFMELHEIAHPSFDFGEFEEPISAEMVALHQQAIEAGQDFDSAVDEFQSYR